MDDYNNVFERLMNRANQQGEPLVGMIAYSIYKQNKVDILKSGLISPEQLKEHHRILTDVLLASLEDTARQYLFTFTRNYLEQSRDELFITFVGSLEKQVKQTEEMLRREIQKETSFHKGFWPGFASSCAFFIFAGLIGFFWAFDYKDVVNYFNHTNTSQLSSPSNTFPQ